MLYQKEQVYALVDHPSWKSRQEPDADGEVAEGNNQPARPAVAGDSH